MIDCYTTVTMSPRRLAVRSVPWFTFRHNPWTPQSPSTVSICQLFGCSLPNQRTSYCVTRSAEGSPDWLVIRTWTASKPIMCITSPQRCATPLQTVITVSDNKRVHCTYVSTTIVLVLRNIKEPPSTESEFVGVAQFVRASASGLCRAERHRFETRSARDFLSIPSILYCMSALSYRVYSYSA